MDTSHMTPDQVQAMVTQWVWDDDQPKSGDKHRLWDACDVVLNQYKQICEDNNVMGWPSLVERVSLLLHRTRRTEQTETQATHAEPPHRWPVTGPLASSWETIITPQGRFSRLRLDHLLDWWKQHRRKHRDNIQSTAGGSIVYLIGTQEHIKIGVTKRPWTRLNALQSGSPLTLRVNAMLRPTNGDGETLERELHQKFTACRVRGEWFRRQDSLADFIVRLGGGRDGHVVSVDTVRRRHIA